MPHDPIRVADVRSWIHKAARDLLAGDHERAAAPPILEDVVFHAQQAAEKVLKGFLAWHDRPFRKTRDLVEIGQACVEIDASLEPVIREAAPLTEYAWKFRYPGEPEEPTTDEADDAHEQGAGCLRGHPRSPPQRGAAIAARGSRRRGGRCGERQ